MLFSINADKYFNLLHLFARGSFENQLVLPAKQTELLV